MNTERPYKGAVRLMMQRWVFVVLAILMNAGLCPAQSLDTSGIDANDDCTDITVDFKDNPNLTRQEKEALMEQALRDSLNKYDRCQDAHKRAAAGGGAGAAGGGGSAAGSDQGGSGESTASTSMKGTNSPVEAQTAPATKGDNQPPSGNTTEQKQTRGKRLPGSGKLPDDIPPADNDSVLEEQIRQAAIHEADPVIKAKLWNEYRRYKGLPTKNKPQGQ